jgi:hypothetical protein
MSGHSRAAIAAGDTIRAVIDQMNDAPFMRERTSERTERTHARVEASTDAMQAIERGFTRAYAERIARIAEDR